MKEDGQVLKADKLMSHNSNVASDVELTILHLALHYLNENR